MHQHVLFAFLAFEFAVVAQDPSTSAPSNSNPQRTTLDIIWSCLATIIACTWGACQLDVPDPSWTSRRRLGVKFLWTGCCLLAPELAIYTAFDRFLSAWKAREDVQLIRKHPMPDDPTWLKQWSMTHALFAEMKGFRVGTLHKHRPISPRDIPFLARRRIINLESLLKDIQDKSKASWLTKGVAIMQTMWLVVQCIARLLRNLPITELELTTIAFALAAVASHVLQWKAPYDVGECIWIKLTDEQTKDLEAFVTNNYQEVDALSFPEQRNGKDLEAFVTNDYHRPVLVTLIAMWLILAFGGIHCAAWSFHFPSHTIRTIWRTCSIIMTVVPFYFLLSFDVNLFVSFAVFARILAPFAPAIYAFFVTLFGLFGGLYARNRMGVMKTSAGIYAASRIIIIVLTFICLRSLPPPFYETVQWTTFIPHI